MNKIKKLIKRHKLLAILTTITIAFVLILSYFFFSLFISGNNKYGNRLKDIKEVEISASDLNKYEKEISKNDSIVKASIRTQGKIIYINIEFKDNTTKDDAKKIAISTLDKFSKEEKKYYDFGYFLTKESEKDSFKITGTKHSKKDNISFIKS